MSLSIYPDSFLNFDTKSVIFPVQLRHVTKGTGYATLNRALYGVVFIYVVVVIYVVVFIYVVVLFKPVDELRRMENALKYRVFIANNACCIL